MRKLSIWFGVSLLMGCVPGVATATYLPDITSVSAISSPGTNPALNNPQGQELDKLFDRDAQTKFTNIIGGGGSGVEITFDTGSAHTITGVGMWTADDAPERDPREYHLFGLYEANGNWIKLGSGYLSPPSERKTYFSEISTIINSMSFSKHKIGFYHSFDTTWNFQLAELEFITSAGTLVMNTGDVANSARSGPEPTTALLLGLGLVGLAANGRRRQVDGASTNSESAYSTILNFAPGSPKT